MSHPILLVDDEVDTCNLAARLLAELGYPADAAYDAQTALALVRQKPYALAIIDYRMPGMNGVELFRQLHQLRPEMKGIFLTGFTTIDVVYPAIREGILKILPKPVDFNELMPIIHQFADEPMGTSA